MSVKRFYWDTPSEYGHAEEHPEGELVWWTDYAKLESENVKLKAENERLRKAGDAMDEVEKCFDGKTPILEGIESVRQIVRRWIKAKEGKPSV